MTHLWTIIPAAAIAFSLAAPVQAQEGPSTLKKVEQTGTFTVATRAASIPFNYLDDNNQQSGFAWEITQRVADKVKEAVTRKDVKLRPMEVTPQTRIPLVANQTVDLECSSTTHSRERENQVNFSTSFFIVGTRMLVPAKSPIKNWSDLDGKNVVVSAGTTAERLLRKLIDDRKLNVNIVLGKDIDNTFMTMDTGRADAAMMDDMVLYSLVARSPDPKKWNVVGDVLQPEAYGCMLRKGDIEFKTLVDGVIAGMMSSGEMTKLYNKYFSSPIKVRGGLNINAPMSPVIKDLFANPNDKVL
jgi:glutamate/aspartate transport system substrate-binding protein